MNASFNYTAIDRNGEKITGQLLAGNRALALSELNNRGLTPASLDEGGVQTEAKSDPPKGIAGGWKKGRIPRTSVEFFTRELANLLAAGVPLSRALYLLSRQTSHVSARRQWACLYEDVVGGMSLAESMGRWPKTFPPIYTAMVQAGETGGFLELVLTQIADFQMRENELKGRVRAALVYPLVLATMAALVMLFLLLYFIPRFTLIFADFDAQLPWLTRMIVGTSHFIFQYHLAIVAIAVLAALAAQRFYRSMPGRKQCERILLSLPGIGTVSARFALVRFCRMLGTLLDAGVPMLPALRVAREATGNSILAATVTRATEEVRHGSNLSASLAEASELFPASVAEMMSVAEEGGRLNRELLRVATVYESELDRRLRMLVALAEPALLFVMAVLIGTVVVGMLLPIFTLQELIQT